MANSVVLQTLEDGPRWAVIKATINVDTSDLAETVIADPALLAGDPLTGLFAALAISGAYWSIAGPSSNIALRFQWKATVNTDALTIGVGNDHQDYMELGGPIKNDSGAGKNGKLVVITTGWAAAQVLVATVQLKLQKTSS